MTDSALELIGGSGPLTRPILGVAIAGFGSIGRLIGRHLDEGVEGLRLVAFLPPTLIARGSTSRISMRRLMPFRLRGSPIPLM